jgi:hypothetical protein
MRVKLSRMSLKLNMMTIGLRKTWVMPGTFLQVQIPGPRDSILKKRLKESLRNKSKFNACVRPGSNGKGELIKLLRRSMAKQVVPWRDLFENGTLLLSL